MKTNLLEMQRREDQLLGGLDKTWNMSFFKAFLYTWDTCACHAWWGYIWYIHCWFTSFKKHQKTKKVLCLLIFANILVLPWGSLAFQFWLKKILEAIHNSTHHFEDLIKMKTATIVWNHTDVPCIYIDSIHISPVILFPSYLLLTHTSGSKSHAGDSVLDITIFDMSKHQRLSI